MSYPAGPKKENDPVRPGEQWFCYWKTSAALWEGRIMALPAHEVVFIPLYWGFHSEGPNAWDFGQVQAERDLLRLSQLLTQYGRTFCWLIPLTPTPFLPNGGVPVSAARTLGVSSKGVHVAALDQEEKLNKLYSFFEPKVFQTYVEFLKHLGFFLGNNDIKAPLWGASFQYMECGHAVSYLADHSVAFEQGFSRYLRKKHKESEGVELRDPLLEDILKNDFTREVEELFKSSVESVLSPFWKGTQTVIMIGGAPVETIERALPVGKSQLMYFKDLFAHYTHDRWISSAILSIKEKGELLTTVLLEHFGLDEIDRRYHYKIQKEELTEEWSPFGLVHIFDESKGQFKETGLIEYLDQNFPWLYKIVPELNFNTAWIEANHSRVKFFHAASMDRTHFSQMLKLFMMGQKVVFDRTGLHPDLDKRLQVFFLENNLKLQAVNFLTNITLCELGEGAFITYEGGRLMGGKGKDFWSNLFRFFKLTQPEIKADEDVFGLWRIRARNPHELNYLDVRRVNFYNPTSYKKHVTINTKNSFAFMKMIDPSKASAKSVSHGVEVEIMPNGRIALDFGHYEEH